MSLPISIIQVINPNEKQAQFLQAVRKYKYTCYGGAAGGGKSYILRWMLILFLLEAFFKFGITNCPVGMFCEDYPALKGRQISQIAKDPKMKMFGKLIGDQNIGHIFRLHPKYGSGYIHFGNLDDPSKYDSFEFAAIAVDEYTKNKAKTISGQTVFDELRKRLRYPAVPGQPQFPKGFIFPLAIGTNPGGPSHYEVKSLWIDKDFSKNPNLKKVADKFKFIKALATDNSFNPPEYYQELLTLPPAMAKAYAEGDWNVFSGQFFSEWRDLYHVVSAEETAQLFPNGIPQSWKRFCAIDWGRSPDPAWCGWFAVSPEGVIYLYRESWGNDRDPQDWGRDWLDLSKGENIAYWVGDPSMNNKGSNGQSVLSMFKEVGLDIVLGDNDRANGWAQMHSYLSWSDAEGNWIKPPKFRVLHTCPYALRTIPAQMHDKNKVNDMAAGEDHACDAIRYGLMSCPSPATIDLNQMDPRFKDAMLRLQHAKNAR